MYLDNYIVEIKKLCGLNGVKSLYAFGSVLTKQFSSTSDVDMLVDIGTNDPLIYAEQNFNLKFELEKLLNRSIDLLETKAIKNPYLLENIDLTKTLIYAA